MIDDAFLEWSDREPETVEEWASTTIRREGFEPWLLPVVVDAEDRIVGAAYLINSDAEEGWVQQLAVHRDHRSRGLGGALLAGSFRRFHERGRRACGVNTDSRTGALGLYEHVGMSVRRTYTHRSLPLNAG
jgi:GNAT superfamily N-acetyltransferase